MARPSLQLAAGLLLLVGLLGLSTALIAEVREEVVHRSQGGEGDPVREAQDPVPGLPVSELTLLDPADADIPEREETQEGFQATGAGQLQLEPGGAIRPGSLSLDQAGELELGSGWDVADEELTCTEPCQLHLDDDELALPANTSLAPPSGTGQLDLSPALEPGTRIAVPQGTSLALPPVSFPSGTTMELAAGAHAELPDPIEEWRSLIEGDSFQLPAGTVLTRSSASGADLEALASLLDGSGEDLPAEPDPRHAEQPTIEITDTPETITKDQTFTVEGTVHGPAGDPLADHPVTVYANATKDAPGLAIQTEPARTDAAGRFTASARLPASAPTQPYHVLAQAHARPSHDPPLTDAWTDPLVPVDGEGHLTLDIPARAGVDVPLSLRAELHDAFEAPIPHQPIAFTVEGMDRSVTARTGIDGEAHAVLPEGLPFTGNFTIQATFPGTGNVTADEARETIEIVEARIEAPGTHRAPRGETTQIEGRVLTETGPPDPVRVQAAYAEDVTASASTDERGRFTLDLPVPAGLEPGNYTLDMEAGAVDATHRLVLTVTAGLQLSVAPIDPQPVGARAPLTATLTADNGTPVAGTIVEASLADRIVSRQRTDPSGQAELAIPVPRAGEHRVQLTVDPPRAYRETTREVTIPAAPLDIEADLALAPDRTTNGTLRLTVDEQPLQDAPLRLVAPGVITQTRTDAAGRAHLSLQAPEAMAPGVVRANLTLLEHQLDTTVPLRILDAPDLSVRVVEQGRDGEPVEVTVSAHGRAGPLAGIPLVAQADGAFQASDRALTGEDGTANLTLPRPSGAEGQLEIDVFARPTPDTSRAVQTASTHVTAAPLPWAWLSAGVLALGVALAAGIRHRRAPGTPSEPEPGPTIAMHLAKQTPGDPPVWHPGEPTSLHLELTDARGRPIPDRLSLEGPATERDITLDGRGRATVSLPSHSRGTHTYRARFEGNDEHPASEAVLELRIVDYREEIDREYRQLRQAATRTGLVGPDATPRELARALGSPADRLAKLFERYDYSPHAVTREDYERFMRLRREADPRG